MMFLTIEDKTRTIDAIIFPNQFEELTTIKEKKKNKEKDKEKETNKEESTNVQINNKNDNGKNNNNIISHIPNQTINLENIKIIKTHGKKKERKFIIDDIKIFQRYDI